MLANELIILLEDGKKCWKACSVFKNAKEIASQTMWEQLDELEAVSRSGCKRNANSKAVIFTGVLETAATCAEGCVENEGGSFKDLSSEVITTYKEFQGVCEKTILTIPPSTFEKHLADMHSALKEYNNALDCFPDLEIGVADQEVRKQFKKVEADLVTTQTTSVLVALFLKSSKEAIQSVSIKRACNTKKLRLSEVGRGPEALHPVLKVVFDAACKNGRVDIGSQF